MEPKPNYRWYVLRTQSGKEKVVEQTLQQHLIDFPFEKIKEVVVPVYQETVYKNGKKKRVEKKSFPGYICLHMIFDKEAESYVRQIPYVGKFVAQGSVPIPLSEEESSTILAKNQSDLSELQTISVDFEIGQKVLIIDGPFNNFVGTVKAIFPDKSRISVNVEIFGRETPVEIDYYKVKKR